MLPELGQGGHGCAIPGLRQRLPQGTCPQVVARPVSEPGQLQHPRSREDLAVGLQDCPGAPFLPPCQVPSGDGQGIGPPTARLRQSALEGGQHGCEGQQVQPVVREDAGQPVHTAQAQPVKPGPRRQRARQIALASELQQPGLRRAQSAVRPDVSKRPADEVQEVQVIQPLQGTGSSRQPKARRQQGHIEGLAVVGHQQGAARERLAQGLEIGRLRIELREYVLAQDQVRPLQPPEAAGKHPGPGPARQAAGLCVEQAAALWRDALAKDLASKLGEGF